MTHVAAPAQEPDEVDVIVDAWKRERPDVDVSAMQVLSRVSRLARHLDRARKQAFAAHSLETWEFDVLAALRRAGPPYDLSPGRLVSETLVTSGTMTNRVDRLVARGLVERRPDPDDRRGVLVSLTASGRTDRRRRPRRAARPRAGDPRRRSTAPRRPASPTPCAPSPRTFAEHV